MPHLLSDVATTNSVISSWLHSLPIYLCSGEDYSDMYQLCLLQGEELSAPGRGEYDYESTQLRSMVRSLVRAVYERKRLDVQMTKETRY